MERGDELPSMDWTVVDPVPAVISLFSLDLSEDVAISAKDHSLGLEAKAGGECMTDAALP